MKLSGETQAMLIKYALIAGAGYFIYSKIKSSAGETIDFVKNIDLNPFDENGWLGLTVPKDIPQIAGYDKSHDAALAKIGADISKYYVYYPNPLSASPMPKGTLQVKWGNNKITYYAPKTGGLQIFSL